MRGLFFFIALTVFTLISVGVADEEKTHHRDWNAYLYGGLTASRGNTDEDAYKYGVYYEKKNGSAYRYFLRIDGRYRETNQKVSDSKADASGEMRRLISENRKWFAACTLSALHDDLKDIKYRTEVGPALGYYLVDRQALSADVSSGFVYVHEETESETEDSVAWRVAQRFKWKVTETLDVWTSSEILLNIQDAEDYTGTLRAGLNNKINSHFGLVVMLENEYDNMPEGGPEVEKNDLEISTGLRYTF